MSLRKRPTSFMCYFVAALTTGASGAMKFAYLKLRLVPDKAIRLHAKIAAIISFPAGDADTGTCTAVVPEHGEDPGRVGTGTAVW